MIRRLLAQDAVEIGNSLAQELARRYPVTLETEENKQKISVDRISRILEGIYAKAQTVQQQHRLGWFRRARLCHAFKWRMHEMGYSKSFTDLATEGLVVYLSQRPVKIKTDKQSRL